MNEMIKRRKRLTEPEAAFFMQDMIGAVKYMHENFVIHRDLKLGNLFLDKNMHIKVGDLGLATRLESAEEKRKTICGTPNYIAPEVIQGSKETRGHSYEVDIWSMGVILYTMLIGKPPYEAKDVKATYKRIIANEYDFPVHTPISPQARDLIASMLQSRPDDRCVLSLLLVVSLFLFVGANAHSLCFVSNFSPTLEEIQQHPFFTEGVQIPLFLPSSATKVAPKWMHDEFGQLVPRPIESEENDLLSASSKNDPKSIKPALARGGSLRRLPLKNKDPNIKFGSEYEKPKENTDDWFSPPGMVQGAVLAASAKRSQAAPIQFERKGKPEIQPAFRVFDETNSASAHSKPPQSRQSDFRVEGLVSRTSTLRLTDDEERTPAEKPSPTDTDAEVLLLMLERLTAVLELSKQQDFSYAVSQVKPTSRGSPAKWITRYVDYTSKYGLGFLMNDGR
jgi:serine/threonine protein kinase